MKSKVLIFVLIASIFINLMPFISYAQNDYVFVCIEAEDAIIKSPYSVLYDEPEAYNGAYVSAAGDVVPDHSLVKDYGIGVVVNSPEEDVYAVWARIKSNYSPEDEFYVYNGGIYRAFMVPHALKKAWNWIKVNNVVLNKGENIVRFAYKEPNVRFDKILVTNDLYYVPENEGEKPVYSSDKKPLVFNLPPASPKVGQHPRVMVNKEDIPKIINNLTHKENIEMYNEVLRQSKLDFDGILPPTEAYRTTNENDRAVGTAESCAFLYLINKDKEMGYKAIKIIKNYLRTLDIKSEGDPVTRHTGYAIYVASCVYDWCYDLLTDEDKRDFRNEMIRNAARMEIGWPPVEQHFVTGHGVEMQTYRDALSMGIALYDEDPDIYNAIAGRIFQEMLQAENYALSAHLSVEGNGYGPFRAKMKLMSTWLFDKIGIKNVYKKDQIYMLYGMTMYDRLPDGRFVMSGDCSTMANTGFLNDASDSCFLAGNYYKDPYIRKMYFKSNPTGKNVATNRYGISAPLHLIVNDPDIGVKSYEGLPQTAFFPDPMSTMVAKTGWDEGVSTDVVSVRMKAGQRSFMNHSHMDSGHFDIYYKGQLALDSGMIQSAPFSRDGVEVTSLAYSSLHDRNYHKRTIAHNAMLIYDPNETFYYSDVNDGGQRREEIPYTYEQLMSDTYDAGKAISYNFGPDPIKPAYSYIKGDIKNAYSANKVENYERTFMFLNFFDKTYPAALIVFDNVKSTNAQFKKTFLLHSQEEPEVVDGNTSIIRRTQYSFNGRIINETLLPKEVTITKIGGPGREFEVNGYNEMAVPVTPYQESGNWRLEISPKASTKQDYFLNVIQIGENDDSITPLKTDFLMDTDDYVGVQIKDRAVFIRKPKEKMYKKFTIKSNESDKEIMHIVNGLKAGKWNIKKDGKTIISKLVGEMQDSIEFTAKHGEYTLEWEYTAEEFIFDHNFIKDMVDITDHEPIDIKIGLRYETFKERPFTENDILYVDAKEYFDKLKFENEVNKNTITVSVKDNKVTFTNGSKIAIVETNGIRNEVELEGIVKIKDDRLKIPIVNIAPHIFTKVTWFDYAKCAFVVKSGVPSDEDKERIYIPTEPGRLEIIDATWSTHYEAQDGYSALDNNLKTYWGASGDGEWIQFTLKEVSEISSVALAWNAGDKRKEFFEILISEDGENYTKVFDGESSGTTAEFEKHKLPSGSKAKYIKIIGHKNSVNDWNSLLEIAVYK